MAFGLTWTQPFSGIQGFVDVKFKDKVITVAVDHFFIETDAYSLLRLFGHDGESWIYMADRNVGSTNDLVTTTDAPGGIISVLRKLVFFKSVVFPGTERNRPLVEIGIKNPV